VCRLFDVLDRLVEVANTVVVIGHNLDVIKNIDWVIDFGLERGDPEGEIVPEGPPREVAKSKRS
jgi:excinuclease ABC subunit A